jgi:hypothetical protein
MVFRNTVLRRKWQEAREDFIVKNFTNYIFGMIKWRMTRWAGNIARIGMRNAHKILVWT